MRLSLEFASLLPKTDPRHENPDHQHGLVLLQDEVQDGGHHRRHAAQQLARTRPPAHGAVQEKEGHRHGVHNGRK